MLPACTRSSDERGLEAVLKREVSSFSTSLERSVLREYRPEGLSHSGVCWERGRLGCPLSLLIIPIARIPSCSQSDGVRCGRAGDPRPSFLQLTLTLSKIDLQLTLGRSAAV